MSTDFEVALGMARIDPLEEANRTQRDDDPEPDPNVVRSWIVQFRGPLDPNDVVRLQGAFGLDLIEFVPMHSFIERLTSATVVGLRQDPVVRAIAPFSSRMKLSHATIGDAANNDASGDGQFNAVLFAGVGPARVIPPLIRLGARILAVLGPQDAPGPVTIRFTLPFGRLEDATALEDLRWIEPAPTFQDDDDASVLHPGTAASIATIWASGLHGEEQIIGVLDNGPPNTDHCFFVDEVSNAPGPHHRKIAALRNGTRQAPGRHATFVAGCAAGDDANRPGEAPNRGGAWAARLVLGNRRSLEVFQPEAAVTTTLAEELSAAAQAGATIHSNSWHAIPPDGPRRPAVYDLLARDVDEFTWLGEDHLVLGASGNLGEEQGSPGTAKNAVCVSAAAANPAVPSLGDGNRGPTADGRRKPDVMAIGCGIQSAFFDTQCGTGPMRECASSYATPLAAAGAALVRQYFTEGFHPSGRRQADQSFVPSGALLKAVLVNSAAGLPAPAEYPNDLIGWGLVQVDRNLHFGHVPPRMLIWDMRHARGLITGGTSRHIVQVTSGTEQLKITLVWSDAPGTLGAGNLLVNLLTLQAAAPNGETLLGNVFRDGVSVSGGTSDVLNNVQTVLVNGPQTGEWTITVSAAAVNRGRPGQGFALVVSGGTPA